MKKLKRVYVEITNVCNLSCSFCPKTKKETRSLTINEFEHIVKKVEKHTDHLYFHVMGEPTLHPNLLEFLKTANAHNLFVNLTTNGTQIKKIAPVLLECLPRKVSFSLHSYEGNNNKISLEEYLKPIVEFAKVATQKNIIVEFRLWNLKNNENKNLLNGQILHFIVNELNLDKTLLNVLHEKSGVTLFPNCYLGFDNEFMWPDETLNLNLSSVYCLALKNQIAILSDGTVVPCCLDYNASITLGNIFNESLEDILNSDLAKKMLLEFKNRTPVCKLCQNCNYAKQKFM
ncbi:MAG: radical SAM protein [Tenericutes bacterium HGW-Tenericutes-4]|nr:MAG: radical SAM protein [Tenericutes bacterium HGW-Tenericutes-4]